ncbi:MAG: DUF1554 domain-containing protein [Leptospira sp.]|nr:DUF1554 domain-containing protein [Leptospira sp.]
MNEKIRLNPKIIFISILTTVGCLANTSTRSSNDMATFDKCKSSVSHNSCEKNNKWYSLVLDQERLAVADSDDNRKNEKIIFVSQAYNGDLGGVSGADNKCATTSFNPDTSKSYKALIVDGSNRVACKTPGCSGGTSEHKDWVLKPLTIYKRYNGRVGFIVEDGSIIGKTNKNGVFTFPIAATISKSQGHFFWTGFRTDWTSESEDNRNCVKWSNDGNGPIKGAIGVTQQVGESSIGGDYRTCNDIGVRLLCVEQ